jgi:hypothetical protein
MLDPFQTPPGIVHRSQRITSDRGSGRSRAELDGDGCVSAWRQLDIPGEEQSGDNCRQPTHAQILYSRLIHSRDPHSDQRFVLFTPKPSIDMLPCHLLSRGRQVGHLLGAP